MGINIKKMLLLSCMMTAVFMISSCKGSTGEHDTSADTAVMEDSGAGIFTDKAVRLSHDSGIYPEEFEVSMTAAKEGRILYTTDGSDPKTSPTAIEYSAPIAVTDRKDDRNIVSAVEPVLFAGSYNKPNSTRDGFVCEISAPEDGAVDKCTVIRAVVQKSDGTFTEETSATYFVGTPEEHISGLAESCNAAGRDLAVISISMNYDDLFGSENGIYVKGSTFENALKEYLVSEKLRDGETARALDANYKQRGREWERPASVVMFEFGVDGAEPVINQQCGIRIQGNYSRSDLQKSFRLYAREEYGDKNFRYAVFGDDYVNDSGETMDEFKTLVLRAGGNCAFITKYNDAFWQQLVEDTACDTKKSRPCVVYLNGEYWGLYVLEEDYSDDFFEDVHGVDKDTVVVYKGDAETYKSGYKLDEGTLPDGESEDYYFRELKEFFDSHTDLKDEKDYEEFIKLVDPQSVMDYFAVQIWINNKWDWPGKNWSMWKTTVTDSSLPYADGRWRLLFYDMDFGGISGTGDVRTNTVKEDNYKPDGLLDMDTDNPAVLCFAYLMTNEAWRNAFYDRLTGLSDGLFDLSVSVPVLNQYKNTYTPLLSQFFERYPKSGSVDNAVNGGYGSYDCLTVFLTERRNHIEKMIEWCDGILTQN